MTPGRYDLVLYRGDTYSWRFALWEDPDKTDPVDLTGATVEAEIRDRPAGATVVALDVTVTLPNLIDVRLPADLWDAGIPAGKWDLEVTDPGGEVRTMVAGSVRVTDDVTNSTP